LALAGPAVLVASFTRQASRQSGGNALAPLGATTLQNKTTGLGGHPLAEAVASGALEVARLKCPFHGSLLFADCIFNGVG